LDKTFHSLFNIPHQNILHFYNTSVSWNISASLDPFPLLLKFYNDQTFVPGAQLPNPKLCRVPVVDYGDNNFCHNTMDKQLLCILSNIFSLLPLKFLF
jgi:hypothetical protein